MRILINKQVFSRCPMNWLHYSKHNNFYPNFVLGNEQYFGTCIVKPVIVSTLAFDNDSITWQRNQPLSRHKQKRQCWKNTSCLQTRRRSQATAVMSVSCLIKPCNINLPSPQAAAAVRLRCGLGGLSNTLRAWSQQLFFIYCCATIKMKI